MYKNKNEKKNYCKDTLSEKQKKLLTRWFEHGYKVET